MAADDDPLFLQVKEARRVVLEPYAGNERCTRTTANASCVGQRLMQSASDIFLGWTRGSNGRDFYVRQLRDMKVERARSRTSTPATSRTYGRLCGWALARAHARSGDAAMIAGYMGARRDLRRCDRRVRRRLRRPDPRDHRAFVKAVRQGRLKAACGGLIGADPAYRSFRHPVNRQVLLKASVVAFMVGNLLAIGLEPTSKPRLRR